MTTVLGNEQVTGDPEELFQGMKSLTGIVQKKITGVQERQQTKKTFSKSFTVKGIGKWNSSKGGID